MDQCFIILLDRGEQINLPAIMIRYITRIAKTTWEHDLGYGFLLTLVFEYFGVVLRKKMGVQMVDEIGSSTLMGCDFTLVKGEQTASEQGLKIPIPPIPCTFLSGPSVDALLQDQFRLKTELIEAQEAFVEEKALNAKCHEDLLALLSALPTKLSPPPPPP